MHARFSLSFSTVPFLSPFAARSVTCQILSRHSLFLPYMYHQYSSSSTLFPTPSIQLHQRLPARFLDAKPSRLTTNALYSRLDVHILQ